MKFCVNCGAPRADAADRFCQSCGHPFPVAEPPAPPPETPQVAPPPAAPITGGQPAALFEVAFETEARPEAFEEGAPFGAEATPAAPLFGEQAPPQEAQPAQDKWQRMQVGTGAADILREPPRLPDPPAPAAKPKKKKSFVTILLLVALFVVGVCGATLAMLYFGNSANKAIDGFLANVAAGDTAALQDTVRLSGVTATPGGWQALADGLAGEGDRDALQVQLRAQAGGEAVNPPYPAITVESEPLFLFIQRYYIRISGVEVLLDGAEPGTGLVLNGVAQPAGTPLGEGLRFAGVMPGRYRYAVVSPGGEESAEAQADMFGAVHYLDIPTDLPDGDGQETPEGQTPPDDTAPEGEIGSAEMGEVVEQFYISYLAAINDQSLEGIQRSTRTFSQELGARISRSQNAANIFEFIGLTIDEQSIVHGEGQVAFNASFRYYYTPRSGSSGRTEDSNRQTVELVLEDGEWRVNRMTFVSDEQYVRHELAPEED